MMCLQRGGWIEPCYNTNSQSTSLLTSAANNASAFVLVQGLMNRQIETIPYSDSHFSSCLLLVLKHFTLFSLLVPFEQHLYP